MKLKLIEAYTRDVGRGIARIDYDTMDELNVSTGDIIELKNKNKTTVAKALPLYPSDEKKNVLRAEGIIRKNLNNIKTGEEIDVVKATNVQKAEEITFYSKNKELLPTLDGRYFSDALESMAVREGDHIHLPYFGKRLEFKVTKTIPKGIVIITQKTNSKISEEDIPDEIKAYVESVKQQKEKIIEIESKHVLKLLKEKKFDEAAEVTNKAMSEIDKIDQTKEDLLKLLRKGAKKND